MPDRQFAHALQDAEWKYRLARAALEAVVDGQDARQALDVLDAVLSERQVLNALAGYLETFVIAGVEPYDNKGLYSATTLSGCWTLLVRVELSPAFHWTLIRHGVEIIAVGRGPRAICQLLGPAQYIQLQVDRCVEATPPEPVSVLGYHFRI